MNTQKIRICPVCQAESLMVTGCSCNCVLCGYYDDIRFHSENTAMKIRKRNTEENKLYKMNEIAQKYFVSRLEESPKAISYLKKRGFEIDEKNTYGFGYNDGKLQNVLMQFGYTEEDMQAAGLARFGKDFFFHRLTIPVRDNAKRVIGFGGRTLEDDTPKYINTPETEIFHKKAVFFGIDKLDFSKDVILCEGFFDVMTMQKNGFNAMATMGTSLTVQHSLLLKELNKKIYLLYDSDAAGRNATIKNMKLLQTKQIPCQWVNLNPYKDPDEFLQSCGKEELQKRIINAKNRKEIVMRSYDTASINEIIDYLAQAAD